MQKPSLLAQAKAKPAGGFEKPDITPFIPPQQADAVARIVAAGMKVMYAPESKDQVMQAVQSQEPTVKKLAESTVGLLLTLDKMSNGGLPAEAMFPAAMELLGEAAEMLSAAGQDVTQQDFNDAALLTFALIAKKLGADDAGVMDMTAKMIPPDAADAPPDEAAPATPAAAAGMVA